MTTSAGDLGPFTGLRLIHATPTVELFTGYERNGRRPVVLIALTEQAGHDPNWSAEFTDAVAKDATTLGPLDVPVHVSDLYGRRPWAASRIVPGRRGAERILSALPGAVAEGTDPSLLLHRPPQQGPQPGQPQPGQPQAGHQAGPHQGPHQGGPPQGGQPHGAQPHQGGPPQGQPQGGQLQSAQHQGGPSQAGPHQAAPQPGQYQGGQQQGGPHQQGPWPQPAVQVTAAPQAQQGQPAFTGPGSAGNFATQQQRSPGTARPASGLPASALPASGVPGYHPAPGPADEAPDGQPTAAIPLAAPVSGPTAVTAPSVAAAGANAPVSGSHPTDEIPAVAPPNSPTTAPPTPTGQSTPSALGGSPAAAVPAPGSPVHASPGSPVRPPGSPVLAGSPAANPQNTTNSSGSSDAPVTSGALGTPGAAGMPGALGPLGTPGGRGTPGGPVGRDSAPRAEGAPKLGPLPPGALNLTVPIPQTTPPTSGPGHPRQPGPGGPGGPGPQSGPGVGVHGGPIGGNTGSFPRPQGLPPQQPPARRNGPRTAILALVAVLAVVVLALCGLATVFVVSGHDDEAKTASTPVASDAPAPAPSRNADQPDDDLPAFKKALPVIVTGAVFDSSEQVDLIQRQDWPFAFRVPTGWLCDPALVVGGPNNKGLECRPPGRANDAMVRVGFRDCDNPCDATTQEMMNRDITPETLTEGDATTSYTELANPKDNDYSLFVSHFFGTGPGEPLRWQVIVQGSSPHTDRAAIQKVANDIRTQTP